MTRLVFKRTKLPLTGAVAYEADMPRKQLRITHDKDGWNLWVRREGQLSFELHRFITEYPTREAVIKRVNDAVAEGESWNI